MRRSTDVLTEARLQIAAREHDMSDDILNLDELRRVVVNEGDSFGDIRIVNGNHV